MDEAYASCNFPKFSKNTANSVDPDQTASLGGISVLKYISLVMLFAHAKDQFEVTVKLISAFVSAT